MVEKFKSSDQLMVEKFKHADELVTEKLKPIQRDVDRVASLLVGLLVAVIGGLLVSTFGVITFGPSSPAAAPVAQLASPPPPVPVVATAGTAALLQKKLPVKVRSQKGLFG
jgi:hypothetical protein